MDSLVILATCWLLGLAARNTRLFLPYADALSVTFVSVGLVFAIFVWRLRAGSPSVNRTVVGWLSFAIGLGTAYSQPHTAPLKPGLYDATLFVEHVESNRHGMFGIAQIHHAVHVFDPVNIPSGTWVRIEGAAIAEGATLRVMGTLRPWVEFRNPSPHPSWLGARKTRGTLRVVQPQNARIVAYSTLRRWIAQARSATRAALEHTLSTQSSAIAKALMVGDTAALDQADMDHVRQAGLSHVLAVSGLHVALLLGLSINLIKKALLFWPYFGHRFDCSRIAYSMGVPLAPLYALYAGGAPSAWRAVIMTSIHWALCALGREPKATAVAAFSVLVFGVFWPDDVLRPAFLLSVLATAAILTLPKHDASLTEQHHQKRFMHRVQTWLQKNAMLSLRTTIATAPLVLWCFGGLPWASVVANLVFVPFSSYVLMPFGALHTLCAPLFTPLVFLTAPLFEWSSTSFMKGASAFASVYPGDLPPLSLAQGIVLCLGACFLLFSYSTRTKIYATGLTLLALGACEGMLRVHEHPQGKLRITFLDVGQGDAALIDLPNGQLMLIDGGGSMGSSLDPGKQVLLPLLRARRREHVDVMVLSHPHPDHYGGLISVMQHMPIGQIWDTGQAEAEDSAAPWTKSLAEVRKKNIPVFTPQDLCNQPRWFGGARLDVVAPCPSYDPTWDPNNNSFVLRIRYGKHSVLFAGDAEKEEETHLVALAANLRTDILKVGHHGSRTSSTSAFLRATSPAVAVISAGQNNPFGHPHPEIVQRLHSHHIRSVRLDRLGGFIAQTNGQDWEFEFYNQP